MCGGKVSFLVWYQANFIREQIESTLRSELKITCAYLKQVTWIHHSFYCGPVQLKTNRCSFSFFSGGNRFGRALEIALTLVKALITWNRSCWLININPLCLKVSDLLVGIDTHTHCQLPFMGTHASKWRVQLQLLLLTVLNHQAFLLHVYLALLDSGSVRKLTYFPWHGSFVLLLVLNMKITIAFCYLLFKYLLRYRKNSKSSILRQLTNHKCTLNINI